MVDIHLLSVGDNVVVELGREGVERLFQARLASSVSLRTTGVGIAREEAFHLPAP
jgi:hypothetical protein